MAGNKECDSVIREELESAGIELDEGGDRKGEVPASVTGKLGPFTFSRAWYYWTVSGPTPLGIAEKMYKHPVGKRDVRVAGHCGCPPPNEWADIVDGNGTRVIVDPDGTQQADYAEYDFKGKLRFVKDLSEVPDAKGIVKSYHIDTQQGLELFADSVRGME